MEEPEAAENREGDNDLRLLLPASRPLPFPVNSVLGLARTPCFRNGILDRSQQPDLDRKINLGGGTDTLCVAASQLQRANLLSFLCASLSRTVLVFLAADELLSHGPWRFPVWRVQDRRQMESSTMPPGGRACILRSR